VLIFAGFAYVICITFSYLATSIHTYLLGYISSLIDCIDIAATCFLKMPLNAITILDRKRKYYRAFFPFDWLDCSNTGLIPSVDADFKSQYCQDVN